MTGVSWEGTVEAVGASRQRGTSNNPFCTLLNNYSNMKIITVVAKQLYHETNTAQTQIRFMLPGRINMRMFLLDRVEMTS